MDRQKVEKFFKDQCTPAEIKEVKAWLKTREGQAYLNKKLDRDIAHLQDDRIRPMTSEIRSEKMWDQIEAGITSAVEYKIPPERKRISHWQATAAVILLLIVTLFSMWSYSGMLRQKEESSSPITYVTDANQQQSLTLSDGTQIRLNSNTKIWIPQDYYQQSREIRLKGEAYFEVVHNEDKPFVVHTSRATIKDLGTAFNVQAVPGEQNVQVAVTEGKVAIRSGKQAGSKSVELTQGQFGYLDLQKNTFRIDQFSVRNYLSWMNGRLQFESASLQNVSRQLSRIYDISFAYSDKKLRPLSLTADFERGTLRKALEVVAMTLNIDYKIEGTEVIWLSETHKAIEKSH